MADLSTLDATSPADVDLVSQGAARIRETRDQTKNSFGLGSGAGGTFAEHYLSGPHKFGLGSTAGRPAAGNAGRLYLNTDGGTHLDFDNGVAWAALAGGIFGSNAKGTTAITSSSALTTSFVTYLGPSGITLATNQWLFAIATPFLQVGASSTVQVQFLLDGVTVVGNAGLPFNISTTGPWTLWAVVTGLAAGAHTIALQATASPATSSIGARTMLTLAL